MNKGSFEWDVREVGEGNKARLGVTRLRKKRSLFGEREGAAHVLQRKNFLC